MPRRLDRLQAANMSDRGIQTWAQRICEQLETALDGIDTELGALAAAQAAQATADAAQAAANSVDLNDKISASSVIPANVITATDNGTNVTITIASHTRVYGDGSQVSITGDTLTGNYSTTYGIYYDDSTCSDTTPSFQKTTVATRALPNFTNGRHFVGTVDTPASGGAATTGGSTPPGTGAGTSTDRDKYSTL